MPTRVSLQVRARVELERRVAIIVRSDRRSRASQLGGAPCKAQEGWQAEAEGT